MVKYSSRWPRRTRPGRVRRPASIEYQRNAEADWYFTCHFETLYGWGGPPPGRNRERSNVNMRYAALAVLAATQMLADVNSTVYLPHIVDGGSWQTTFVIANLATLAPGQAIIHLWAGDGAPLAVPFSGVSGGAPVSQVTVNLPPSGVVTLETLGNAVTTTVGW